MGDERPVRATRIAGPVRHADLAGLYARLCALLGEQRGQTIDIDIRGVQCDAVAVEALARLALGARRHGCRVRLEHASDELRSLIAFMGLADALDPVSRDGAADRRAGRARPSEGRT